MSGQRPEPSFFDLGMNANWDQDRFSPEEKAAFDAWYNQFHGTGDLKLVPFVPFLMEHLPRQFKDYRRWFTFIEESRDGVALPFGVSVLLFLHLYAVIANERGILYEILAARRLGMSKAVVMDTFAYAFLSGGPASINAVATLSDEYLRSWPDDAPSTYEWPAEWVPNPAAFRSGMDLSTTELNAADVAAIKAWHTAAHGAPPRHVDLWAKLHPAAYKAQRIRYERALGSALPAQLAPLYTLNVATVRLQRDLMRSSVLHAMRLGVKRHQVVQTLYWAFFYGGDLVMEAAGDAVGDLLEAWPS